MLLVVRTIAFAIINGGVLSMRKLMYTTTTAVAVTAQLYREHIIPVDSIMYKDICHIPKRRDRLAIQLTSNKYWSDWEVHSNDASTISFSWCCMKMCVCVMLLLLVVFASVSSMICDLTCRCICANYRTAPLPCTISRAFHLNACQFQTKNEYTWYNLFYCTYIMHSYTRHNIQIWSEQKKK